MRGLRQPRCRKEHILKPQRVMAGAVLGRRTVSEELKSRNDQEWLQLKIPATAGNRG